MARYCVKSDITSNVASISLVSLSGVTLDTMTRRSKGSNQFNASRKSVSQLIKDGGRPLCVQTSFGEGTNIYNKLDVPKNFY